MGHEFSIVGEYTGGVKIKHELELRRGINMCVVCVTHNQCIITFYKDNMCQNPDSCLFDDESSIPYKGE